MKGVTTEYAANGQIKTAHDTVKTDGIHGILGAAGRKPAAPREKRRDEKPVHPDKKKK